MLFKSKFDTDYTLFHKCIHIFIGGLLALECLPYKIFFLFSF